MRSVPGETLSERQRHRCPEKGCELVGRWSMSCRTWASQRSLSIYGVFLNNINILRALPTGATAGLVRVPEQVAKLPCKQGSNFGLKEMTQYTVLVHYNTQSTRTNTP